MEILKINQLAKGYGEHQLFKNVSFVLNERSKIGLVGKNGVGKSTLLRILSNLEKADNGNIIKSQGVKVGYLEQQPNYPNMTVKEVLSLAYKQLTDVSNRMKELEKLMETDIENLDSNIKLYGMLQEKFELLGGYEIEYKVNTIITGFNFSEEFCGKMFSNLSGGQKTKVLLAKLLIESPQIILLDEPTNYLDLEALEWLEDYIASFNGSIIVVSRDRYFLDRAVNEIVELTPDEAISYKGNYSYYVEEKERRFNEQLKDYNEQQKDIKRMQEQIKWMQSTGSNVLKAKAHQIESRLEKMDEIDKPKVDNRKIHLALNGSVASKKRIIYLEDLSKSFERQLFSNVSGEMIGNDSVGIVGSNGVGKTTMLKCILGMETPDTGVVRIGENLKVGFLDQESKFRDEEQTVLDAYCLETGEDMQKARTQLAKLMFTGDDVYKKIKVLSGGEKKKLKMSILMASKPNLLILDEPTNHLDLQSREELEEKLIDFDGALLFVSHDRYFLNKIASKIWELTPDGLFKIEGNYDDYCIYKEIEKEEHILRR